MINLIVAMDRNNLIGANGGLPWAGKLPDDLKYFKHVTTSHVVLMGKRTWDSLPVKPLPDRLNWVLSKNHPNVMFDMFTSFLPYYAVDSVSDALDAYETISEFFERDTQLDLFVIGGASVYAQFIPYVQRMYITRIDAEFEGDTYFPSIDMSEWTLADVSKGVQNSKNIFPHQFEIWNRK